MTIKKNKTKSCNCTSKNDVLNQISTKKLDLNLKFTKMKPGNFGL